MGRHISRIHEAVSNPALSYINSLAATNTTGGRANARFMLERFCRFLIGGSVNKMDWLVLLTDPNLTQRAIAGFLRYKAQQKAFYTGRRVDVEQPYLNMHLTPVIEGIHAVARAAINAGYLTESQWAQSVSQLSKSDLDSIEPLEYGWLPESMPAFTPVISEDEISLTAHQALEGFSTFCITSCIHRFDWDGLLTAPVVKATISEYLDQGVILNGEKERDYSPATADNLFRMIRGVAEHHWLAENITVERLQRIKAIKLPRGSRKTSGRYISYQDLDKILNIASTHPNPVRAIRDQAIFSVLYETGLRRSEIISLSMGCIDWSRGCINIIGKGNKERNIYFDQNGEMIKKLNNWLSVRNSIMTTDTNIAKEPIFCGISKSKVPTGKKISTQTINDICKWLSQHGFHRTISPHDFRHSLATNLLSQNFDLLSVSQVLGHSSLSTTQRYDQRGEESLRQTIVRRI
ncbi:tyrosine-type recombinase/integrase [Photobacterium aquae]|uniref:tyrosine-type recombinase/integrase n=1 Tax=Photobacterium aquae TaxID=1195763 RepID=UPI00147060F2|nr:tyrosine-type recombinase/integrase [Photobacterium aquae]